VDDKLAEGVEARSFAADFSAFLPAVEEQAGRVQELVERLPPGVDVVSGGFASDLRPLVEELRLLDQETRAFRDLLVEALSRASAAARPLDRERVRAAEEAYARGETKRFSQR
jgi:hypothetical protein